MKRAIIGIILITSANWLGWGQSADTQPRFEAVDVHVSAKTPNSFVRNGPTRGGRYEAKSATMVDLIRIAYGFDADKILGGPNWLEMDRFDVIGKLPAESTPESQKLMLQAVLEDRFQLKLHKDTKPLPTYALTVGKKPQLKEAAGSEDPGCRPQAATGAPAEGGIRLMMTGPTGAPTTLNLGPGMTVQYNCRNMTMAAFAAGLRGMIGASMGQNPVLDETGLKGNWNFDLKYSMQLFGPAMGDAAERISIFAAVEKQLGLKLEEKQVSTPVIVVDRVSQKPSDNPPGVAEALPPIPLPKEFEVASIKLTDTGVRMSRFQMQPGGRLVVEGMPLRFLIGRAFNTNNNDQIVGLPAFAMTDRYDINAKTSSDGPATGAMDMDAMAPLMLSLLTDRFKMTYHSEDRPVVAYSLVAAKPKMKKADPASRTFCRNTNAAVGAPPGSRTLTCQNISMAQFAERLQNMTPEINWPVQDSTGIEGGWDFTLTFQFRMGVPMPPPGRGGEGAPAGAGLPAASDPTDGYTLFEAIEKQLGLKLDKQKRSLPVIVVDHIEQKPTEN